jgi:hypothetical protein
MTRTVHTRRPGSRAARFTQRDVARALKGAVAAGVKVAIEIATDGRMRVVMLTEAMAPSGEKNDWD